MPDREKLIELIVQGNIMAFGKSESFAEIIADHLISHGVTVRERGRWIEDGGLDEDGNGQYRCSNCGVGEKHNPTVRVSHCWNCGADMR